MGLVLRLVQNLGLVLRLMLRLVQLMAVVRGLYGKGLNVDVSVHHHGLVRVCGLFQDTTFPVEGLSMLNLVSRLLILRGEMTRRCGLLDVVVPRLATMECLVLDVVVVHGLLDQEVMQERQAQVWGLVLLFDSVVSGRDLLEVMGSSKGFVDGVLVEVHRLDVVLIVVLVVQFVVHFVIYREMLQLVGIHFGMLLHSSVVSCVEVSLVLSNRLGGDHWCLLDGNLWCRDFGSRDLGCRNFGRLRVANIVVASLDV